MRFWSLRLREVGIVKSDPKKLLAQGSDWRFVNELKKEPVEAANPESRTAPA
jgi:NitT/TauT family transport system substrate-binding protein